MMYDTEVMKPFMCQNYGLFLIFQQKKSIIFVKNTDIENSNTWARRWGCVLSYKIIKWLIWNIASKLWTQMCQNHIFFSIFQEKKSIIFVKNTDIENSNTWARRWGCVLSYKIIIWLIWNIASKLWTQMCQNHIFFSIFQEKKSIIFVKNTDI